MSIHNCPNLNNAEKLVYLQRALKDGSAKPKIEGLSQSGEQYTEAVDCLTARFDRPHLIHQTHVKMILDAPQVRDGSGENYDVYTMFVQRNQQAKYSTYPCIPYTSKLVPPPKYEQYLMPQQNHHLVYH